MAVEKVYSVLGLSFGDEGKGVVVDRLCSLHPSDTIVVRHSGGHQVGHTVRIDDIIHEFHHFGSGALRDIPTYWDKECTVSPYHFIIERDVLLLKGIKPTLFVNSLCPITTPFDIAHNRCYNNQLGVQQSTGAGFTSTLDRHKFIPLFVKDLYYPTILKAKLTEIENWYEKFCAITDDLDYWRVELDLIKKSNKFTFEEQCEYCANHIITTNNSSFIDAYKTVIFEGNQGILLDSQHGIQPYVTHGKTTNYNLKNFDVKDVHTHYVTRCYSTRHGEGDMLSVQYDFDLINNQDESNHYNEHQGNFRTAPLNLDLIKYAICSNESDYMSKHRILNVTCLDHFDNIDTIPYLDNNILHKSGLLHVLKNDIMGNMMINNSSESKTMKEYYI